MKSTLIIDSKTLIDTLLDRYPKLAEVFNAHGLSCVGCVFSRFHSLGDAATIYHLDEKYLINELSHKMEPLSGMDPLSENLV